MKRYHSMIWLYTVLCLCRASARSVLDMHLAIDSPVDIDHVRENRTLLSRRLNHCAPTNPTCTCVNPSYPCYYHKSSDNKCRCGGTDESTCNALGGQFCSRPTTCVANCQACKSSTECSTCKTGYWLLAGNCATSNEKFNGGTTSVHVKDNLVLLGNSEVYQALTNAYNSNDDRFEAIAFAARAFLHTYKDVFDGILVFPYQQLTGTQTNGQQWGASSVRETNGKLQSLISLQNYGPSSSYIPLLHEVAHRWGVFIGSFPAHWSMSALDKQGMLGGFARTNMKCQSGTFPNCNTNTLLWDFNSGAPMQSHDGIGTYSKYELLLMGLYSPAELSSEPPLVYCKGVPNNLQYQSGTDVAVDCSSIEKMTPSQVDAAIKSYTRETQISNGAALRMVALVVFPSANDATVEAQLSGTWGNTDLNWLNSYIGATPARFASATFDRASMSFSVSGTDLRSVPSSPTPPPPTITTTSPTTTNDTTTTPPHTNATTQPTTQPPTSGGSVKKATASRASRGAALSTIASLSCVPYFLMT